LIGAGILTAGFKQTWLYVILAALGLIASISFIFVRKPLIHTRLSQIENETAAGHQLNLLPDSQEKKNPLESNQSFCQIFSETLKMSISPRFRFYIGQCFWTGISIAYFSSLVSPIIGKSLTQYDELVKLEKTLYCISLLGVGEMLGAFIMG